MAVPELAVDAVKYDAQLAGVLRREARALEGCRAIAELAVLKVQQDHGVSAARAQELFRGKLPVEVVPEGHVALSVVRVVVVLEEVDARNIRVNLAQEQRAAEAAVADDEIRLNVRPFDHRPDHPVAVPHIVLEGARAEVVV